MKRSLPALSFSAVSPLVFLPTYALADIVQRSLEQEAGSVRFWLVSVAVQLLTASGYAASSLPKWGGWRDASTHDRLALFAGAIAGLLAGNIFYYVGLYYGGFQQVLCFAACIGGGFAGEKALTAYFDRTIGKFSSMGEGK